MKNLTKYIIITFVAWSFLTCSNDEFTAPTTKGVLVVENVNGTSSSTISSKSAILSRKQINPAAGWIHSAAPDYLKVTLLEITVQGNFDGAQKELWQGEKEITLSGESVDISNINADLAAIPVGTLAKIIVRFKSQAKIKGSLTGNFKLDQVQGLGGVSDELTVHTKSDYSYNAFTKTGGATDYTVFETGIAEETEIWLDSENDIITLEFPISQSISEEETPQITLFFDLNRTLRFFNGRRSNTGGGGVNPTDPDNKAYFFSHSLFGNFISMFVGKTGSIEGYSTVHTIGEASVNGWLTLLFDSNNQFVSGMLLGNNDNDMTIAKGRISEFTKQTDGSYSFTYTLAGEGTTFEVTGFQRTSVIGNTTSASFNGTLLNNALNGECSFTLELIK